MEFKKLIDRKWTALMLIVIVSFVANQLVLDLKKFQLRDNPEKDFIEISIIIFIYILGLIGLSKNLKQWLRKTWSFFYVFFILFLILTGLVNIYVYTFVYNNQYRFGTIKQLLINPLVYLVFLGLDKITDKKV